MPTNTVTFSGGYGNLNGGISVTDNGWGDRIEDQASLIVKMNVSWFVANELHSKNHAYLELMDLMPVEWAIGLGKDITHLLYRVDMYRLVETKYYLLPGNAWLSLWHLHDIPTGVRFWVLGTQLSNDGTKYVLRVQQTKAILANTGTVYNGILCIDKGSSTPDAGYPTAIFAAANWIGLNEKSPTAITSGD